MSLLQEFGFSFIHWSLGLTVLIGLTASEFSGPVTVVALSISATSITLSALCGSSLNPDDNTVYKKRRFRDILAFFKIWIEILEILAASATCARIASATVDYISSGRLREWFLGLESHSLGEPWPDILGVSVVIVITGLFMLGLEKSPSFSALLLMAIAVTFAFFTTIGSLHTVINISQWWQDLKFASIHSIVTAAALCSFGFTNTFPKLSRWKTVKILVIVLVPLVLYSTVIVLFTLMSHYKELMGTATPLLRVFELRDVDWARLIMAICVICIVCLALTEILPSLYGLFVTLASKEWQIFLTSLQYRNAFTGAPLLAIFAAGSLAAILAFACPLAYLVKILSTSTLLKCILTSFHVLYCQYKPEVRNMESYLVSSTSTQYSKLKQSKSSRDTPKGKGKVAGIFSGWKKNTPASIKSKKKRGAKGAGTTQDNEYLLLNDYCDKSVELALNEASSEESDEKESILSSDIEESYSSTDIDAVVQEYKDKVQVATVDNFTESRYPTYITSTTVVIFLVAIIIMAVCLSEILERKQFHLLWSCLSGLLFSTIVILVMPKNPLYLLEDGLLPKPVVPLCAILSIEFNIVLVASIMKDVWPGFIFWFCAGGLLFWRCDCCTCDGLLTSRSNELKITENIARFPDKYVDTILIAR